MSIGIGLKPTKDINITLDFYSIDVKDRIVYSSSISSKDSTTILSDILKSANVKTIQFFINGIKTRTQGLDFVANYKNICIGKGKMALNLAGNYMITNEIIGSPNEPTAIKTGGSSILNAQIKSLLTESRPRIKVILGIDYNIKKWNFSLNNTLFGKTAFQDLDASDEMENVKQEFKPAVVTDFSLGHDITPKISVSFTANNMFNILPKWELRALNPSGQSLLNDPVKKNLLEGAITFSGRYRILGYNGSQFSQLGTTFSAALNFKL